MKFRAICSTEDKRLTKDAIYQGSIVHIYGVGLRICVYDDTRTWMTFDPKVFIEVRCKKEYKV